MTTSPLPFGKCRHCETPALVKLNGVPLCLDHYEDELRTLGNAVGRTFDELGLEHPQS